MCEMPIFIYWKLNSTERIRELKPTNQFFFWENWSIVDRSLFGPVGGGIWSLASSQSKNSQQMKTNSHPGYLYQISKLFVKFSLWMGGCFSRLSNRHHSSGNGYFPPLSTSDSISNHPPPAPPARGPDSGVHEQRAPMAMPYAHVDTTLRALAGQAEGFGRHAIGGVHGSVYHVTTLDGIIFSCFCIYLTKIFHIAF